ncbi:MAG: hypothetical protein ACK4E8_12755, partial [Lacibacter sp.]
PASSNHIFCIARNTGQPHQKKHDLTMRAKIKTDTVYATLPNSTKVISLTLLDPTKKCNFNNRDIVQHLFKQPERKALPSQILDRYMLRRMVLLKLHTA